MDFNKLKTFIHVAQLESISKAADLLNITQPAVTKQIKLLEQELEISLFDRANARIYLNYEGEQLYEFAKTKFQEIEDQVIDIKKKMSLMEGTIRIGTLTDIGCFYLPRIIKPFEKKFPKVRFLILEGNDELVEEALLDNKIDIAFCIFLKDKKLFEIHQIIDEQVILVASGDYLSTVPPIRIPEDLLRLNLIDYNDELEGISAWFKLCAKSLIPKLIKKKPKLIAENSIMIREMLIRGLGVGMIPKFMVNNELESGKLIHLLPEKSQSFSVRVDIAVKKKRNFNLAQREFFTHLLSHNTI